MRVVGRASFVALCPNGCQVNPGAPDTCAFQAPPQPTTACFTDSTPSCGVAFGLDANGLFACQNGQTQLLQNCVRGCRSNPAGVPDQCN